jgi:FMN-dependent NADH-azoreductase
MSNLLVINSSALGDASASRQLVAAFVDDLKARVPGLTVTTRDVGVEPPPHLTPATVGALRRGEPETDAERATRVLSDKLIAEVNAADVIVIGAPMYNLGIPSPLKTWFDHVLRAGATFRYTATGVEGLVGGKRVIVIETRGGFYSEGPAAAYDAQEPHLRAMLGIIGITDPTFVRAEKLAISPEAREAALASATDALKEIAAKGLAPAA